MSRYPTPEGYWFEAEEGEVHGCLIDYVSEVERKQSGIYERMFKLACLYDPFESLGHWGDVDWNGFDANVSENLVASNIDTVAAVISRSKPRVRFMTDGADWSTQRTAKKLEFYADAMIKKLKVHQVLQHGFKLGCIMGTALVKVYSQGGKVHLERVLADEIIVDNASCPDGRPVEMAQRKIVDREILKRHYPDCAEDIDRAEVRKSWANYRMIEDHQIVVLEAWRLPFGEPDDDDYLPGRRAIVIDGKDLVDEEYDKPYFPFAKFVYSDRTTGYYGISAAERIAGHQRQLNKHNFQLDNQIDHHAFPTVWVHITDADIAGKQMIKSVNRAGKVAVHKYPTPPLTVTPQGIGEAQFRRGEQIKESAGRELGVSQLMSGAMKPAGIDSGEGLREFRAGSTERFATPEQNYEQWFKDTVFLILDACKDLGSDAPVVAQRNRYGTKKLKWRDVDMGDVEVWMEVSNSLPKTPAGRRQQALEWAQAGVISMDEFRRLSEHPDLERVMSSYIAAYEDIERCIEEMLDGELVVPEPYQSLDFGIRLVQASYLKARGDGAPEEILENLRGWITQAAHILNPPTPPQMPLTDPASMIQPMDALSATAGQALPADIGATPGMGPATPTNPMINPAIAPQAAGHATGP